VRFAQATRVRAFKCWHSRCRSPITSWHFSGCYLNRIRAYCRIRTLYVTFTKPSEMALYGSFRWSVPGKARKTMLSIDRGDEFRSRSAAVSQNKYNPDTPATVNAAPASMRASVCSLKCRSARTIVITGYVAEVATTIVPAA
jgi:hypothetical protein